MPTGTPAAVAEGQRIIAELRAGGLQLTTIADKTHMARETIRRWMNGRAPVNGEYLMRLRELRRLIQLPGDAVAPAGAAAAQQPVLLDPVSVIPSPSEAEPAPAIVAAPEVPPDTRGASQRVKDWMKDVMLGRTPPVLPSPQLVGPESKGGAGAGAAGSTLPLVAGETDFIDLIAGALAFGIMFPSKWIFRPPYIGCRPQYVEAEAISSPIARIIARQLKLKGYLDDTTRDLCVSLYATGRYVDRAWDLHDAIDAQRRQQQQSGGGGQPTAAGGGGNGYQPASAYGVANGLAGGGYWGAAQAATPHAGAGAPGDEQRLREHAGGGGERSPGATAGAVHQAGTPEGDQPTGELYADGSDPLHWLLAADADGRRRLGLN